MEKINKMIRKIFKWIFKKELLELNIATHKYNDAFINYQTQEKRIKNLLDNIDISVDYHQYSPSWAVISIQGEKQDYIKFIDLGKADIREIASFLKKYDRSKVDAAPQISPFFKLDKYKF
jgi:hypothetical protein